MHVTVKDLIVKELAKEENKKTFFQLFFFFFFPSPVRKQQLELDMEKQTGSK